MVHRTLDPLRDVVPLPRVLLVSLLVSPSSGLMFVLSDILPRLPREPDGPSRPRNQPGPPHYSWSPGATPEALLQQVHLHLRVVSLVHLLLAGLALPVLCCLALRSRLPGLALRFALRAPPLPILTHLFRPPASGPSSPTPLSLSLKARPCTVQVVT